VHPLWLAMESWLFCMAYLSKLTHCPLIRSVHLEHFCPTKIMKWSCHFYPSALLSAWQFKAQGAFVLPHNNDRRPK